MDMWGTYSFNKFVKDTKDDYVIEAKTEEKNGENKWILLSLTITALLTGSEYWQNVKKTSSRGGAYLDMILSDNDGEISAKLWDYNENTHGKFETDMFVKVRGTISQYNGADQLRVEKCVK